MTSSMETLSSLLGRNIALNLAGQIAVVIAAVVAIPFIARGLGTEEFGVLSLVWVLLGCFSLFDLGLGRATTKFVAEYLSRDQVARLPGLIWTSLGLHLLVGSLGGILLASTVPLLVGKILRVPVGLTGEVTTTFFILAAALPCVFISFQVGVQCGCGFGRGRGSHFSYPWFLCSCRSEDCNLAGYAGGLPVERDLGTVF